MQPVARHLKHADLIRWAKAVLDRAQDAEVVATLALKVKHGIDHMFDHARACDLAVFGDMADEYHRDTPALSLIHI